MLDILWTPIILFSLWAYIGFNIFRYNHFEYKNEGKNLILFILFRVIVIGALVAFLFLSFKGYVFYNQMKLFFYFILLFAIAFEEFMYSFFLYDTEFFIIFGILLFGFVFLTINCPIGFAVYHMNREEVDPEVTKYDIVTSDDTKNDKDNKDIFGIEGYRKNEEFYYSFYYIEEDEKIVHEDLKEQELKDNIYIIDGDNAYFEKKKKMYIDKEQINKVPYDDGVVYGIYAPKSAFHGEFSNQIVPE